MGNINEEARNKYLILKGTLAEKCGFDTELYREVCNELDDLVSSLVDDVGSGLGLCGSGIVGCNVVVGHNTITENDLIEFVSGLKDTRRCSIIPYNLDKKFDDALMEVIKEDYPLDELLMPHNLLLEKCSEPTENNYFEDKKGHRRPYRFHR